MFRKIKLKLGNQSGSGQVMFSLALVAVAGGVATYMATNDERSIREAKVQASRDSSQVANGTNMSVLSSLMRFPSNIPPAQQVASNPAYLPAVYPDPYIYGNSVGSVRLASLKSPSAGSRWGSNGQGEITVKGFNGGKVSDSSMDAVFQNGGSLQLTTDNQHADSKINLTGVTPAGTGTRIDKIRVASLASVTDGAQGNYQDTIEAELTVPTPPPPEVKSTGNLSTPLSWGQSATIRFQGYGLMTSFVAYPLNNQSAVCRLAVPAAGNSIRNSASGGFGLGSCNFGFQTPDKSSPDPAVGYITVRVEATGPGGSYVGAISIPAYNPPKCSFAPTTYQANEVSSVYIYLNTAGGGPVTGAPQLEMPVNSTYDMWPPNVNDGWKHIGNWVNASPADANRVTWAAPFGTGYNYGQADIFGRVTGPGIAPGTWRNCENIAAVNINQTVCFEHTLRQYFYLGQCYRKTDGQYVKWYAYGPKYNKCMGRLYYYPGCYYEIGTRDGGCFAPETKIQLADGSSRRIDELQAGDLVFNPLTGRSSKFKGMVKGPEKEPMIELGYDGKFVRVTTKHPMLTMTGIKPAMDLRSGEEVLGADKKFHKLSELRRLPVDANQQVYNFVVDDPDDSPAHHVVVADGILTGDLQMQKDLEKTTKPAGKTASN